jgi:UTP--glucose-1-phosphate uridylyltransferase
MPGYVDATLTKAERAGAHPTELAALRRRLDQLTASDAGQLPGSELEPLPDLPRLDELPEPSETQAREVLDRLVVVKLNGGLGTSMGLSGPKSLLSVKDGHSFLDIFTMQVLALRQQYAARLPLLLMNSPSTRGPSLAALARHPATAENGPVPLDFLQGREPKLRERDHLPVEWPANPELEWCPPGHGDLYTALAASGVLDALLEAGVRWCFVSNADNLGAVPDARLAAWVAAEGVPFAMEAVRGTAADRKGGHLARYGGRTVLRETAQVPPGDDSFTDVERWRFYNTNNLWIDLEALRALQREDPGGPALPLIVNRKTVDPSDASSTPVIQLETAMGAAIGSIEGAAPCRCRVTASHPSRPPTTCSSSGRLLRADAGGLMLARFDGPPPFVALDKEHYKLLPGFEARFPRGRPSLRRCDSLTVAAT